MSSGQHAADPRGMRLIDEYLEHMRRAYGDTQTVTDRRGILERLDEGLPFGVGQVSTEDLRAWLYRPDAGWSQNTLATYFRCIKSFYDWASDPDDPWLSSNPARGLERTKTAGAVPRACTDEQLADVLARAQEPYRTWAILAAYNGLRCCEIAGLYREHVTERELVVVRGKGGKPRVHDTDVAVWAAVRDLPRGPLARHRETGERATARYVSARAGDHFKRVLGIPVTLHRLRHWLGTTVQREYRDIRVTQRLLGHATLASTQVYTTATDEQQRAARATLPRFGG
jgi:integrase/recombinase XerC